MANYRPKANTVAASVNHSGMAVLKNVSTSSWGMALLQGTAISPLGTAMESGAVDVWEAAANTTAIDSTLAPTHTTFTDVAGQYGVTVKASRRLLIKFYGK